MTSNRIKRAIFALGLGAASFTLSACDGVTVGVGYGYDPFYDSMLWNDYYHDVDVDIDVDRPPRPRPPEGKPPARPKPPVGKPPARPRPPTARPPAARPPIHRPAPRPRR
ncbi:hypothetical protein RUE5091_00867 [Ruegeria denitrificans]|uniref:Beta antigen n=1 Tax=Ruegeria denitrificans TaxID=1715692 RepID=A0A0P1I4K7_9RHOB|nr:hypothetical protein [Ruegeria denitrificans]CUJ89405.1 hypothetical protein RUE5091_00867 [Ruegeria denitrificans]